MNRSVWVLAEQKERELLQVSLELLMEGRKLAHKLSDHLNCVLIGSDVQPLCPALARYGAEKIFLADQKDSEAYDPDYQIALLESLIKKHSPWILLIGATPHGRELAPKLAARLKTGLVTDCTILDIDEKGLLLMTKFIYGGKASAMITCPNGRPQMATIRPGLVDLDKGTGRKEAEILAIDPLPSGGSAKKILGLLKGDPKQVDLTEAERIVVGGGGVKGKEEFKLIEELAEALGASVGGSRVAVDKGWVPFQRQIGITGKVVAPEVMIICGVSGAVHFEAGVKDSKMILAINSDRNAPIFKRADIKVSGDLHQVIPEILKRVKGPPSGKKPIQAV